jgi:E3 ubiquitin-protein ligase DRIP
MQTGPASPEAAKEEEEVVEEEDDEEEGEEDGGEQPRRERERERRRRRRRKREAAAAASEVVMVKRELLARCMTCPLCRRILRDATTVSECLHTCNHPPPHLSLSVRRHRTPESSKTPFTTAI